MLNAKKTEVITYNIPQEHPPMEGSSEDDVEREYRYQEAVEHDG